MPSRHGGDGHGRAATRDPRRVGLYGGVSLAVYENGVTRSLFDLVRKQGPFGPLLELLDAKAVVDVVAGTSAGGINGLLLAAAVGATVVVALVLKAFGA